MLRDVVDVDHRGGDVGVPHVGLDVGEWEDMDGEGAEGGAQVVKSQHVDRWMVGVRWCLCGEPVTLYLLPTRSVGEP
jgi:hypothetical protein